MEWLEKYRGELNAVFAEAERIVGDFPAPFDSMASAYLEKFTIFREDSSKNYICYLLPYWTEEATKLDASVYRRLSLANVFAMLHFFIQDDLMDSKGSNIRDLLPISNFLLHESMNIYYGLFPPHSSFWSCYQTYLAEWSASVIHENDQGFFTQQRGKLAHKASLVKLGSTGPLILADMSTFIPLVSEHVETVLETLQMVDDYEDWQDDMSEGCYNSLIAFAQTHYPEQTITESLMRKLIYDGSLLERFAETAVRHHRSLKQLQFKLSNLVSFHQSLVDSLTGAAAYFAEQKKKLESGGIYYLLSKNEKFV